MVTWFRVAEHHASRTPRTWCDLWRECRLCETTTKVTNESSSDGIRTIKKKCANDLSKKKGENEDYQRLK